MKKYLIATAVVAVMGVFCERAGAMTRAMDEADQVRQRLVNLVDENRHQDVENEVRVIVERRIDEQSVGVAMFLEEIHERALTLGDAHKALLFNTVPSGLELRVNDCLFQIMNNGPQDLQVYAAVYLADRRGFANRDTHQRRAQQFLENQGLRQPQAALADYGDQAWHYQ
jgi:hypothetical protein